MNEGRKPKLKFKKEYPTYAAGYGTTLDFGAVGPAVGSQWLQVTDVSNLAITYPLLLQPNGGNVGIGTSSPASTFGFSKTLEIVTPHTKSLRSG